ncbi:fungal-specific transcription factor domain-containing protein [Aspergillus unguis]
MASDSNDKPRHRASVACMACRERRTRCVVNTGETACTQCQESGQECIIKNDDQRRKPVSKAYVSLLEEQIQQLESALREKDQQVQPQVETNERPNPSPSDSPGPLFQHQPQKASDSPHSPVVRSVSPVGPALKKSSMVHQLLSTKGHVSFDQLAGQQRYYGPTTNCHIYLAMASENEENRRQAREQIRRTQRVLSALPQESQEYLMDMFWTHYNSVIRVVHQEAFKAGRDAGGGPYYSGFLHICILAAGYRFADKTRPDMQRITLSGRESLLHREAKYMLDYEMERPGGLPSIAALLLLGDLEVGCGRDNAGWLYSGMAYRLCFDVGLHLDRSGSGLSENDIEIGRMTLWACVIFDRYWALFLGRPTALKPDDLEIYELSQQFDRLGTSPPGSDKSLELQIYQALFELMEMAGKITNIMPNMSTQSAEHERVLYLRMASLDSEIEKWYTRLPAALKYTAENANTAPRPFFLLHQQYYSTMIMLHRPFAGYDDILDSQGERKKDPLTHLSALSHQTCTTCAGRIAQIFWQQRQRFDTRSIFVTGLQHAGNASTALVAAIASSTDRVANDRSLRYLECLTAIMDEMAEAYQPAEQMGTIFKAVLQELKDLQPALHSTSSVPARRGSSADRENEPAHIPSKRGHSARNQSMSWPGEGLQPPIMSTIMPSPALTYQSEKPARRVSVQHNIPENQVTSLEDSWSIFSAPDRSAVGNVMAGGSPGFSPWPTAETPSFFRMANEMALESGNFMDLVNSQEGVGDMSGTVGLPETRQSTSRGQGQRQKPKATSPDSIWTEIIS